MSDALSAVGGVDLSSSVSVAVARKALEMAKLEGSAAVSLIRAAGSIGNNPGNPTGQAMPGEPGARLDLAA